MQNQEEEEMIQVELRADLAVYVTSSLYAICETIDKRAGPDSDPVVKSRLAAIEVLCDALSRSLSEQMDREKIDNIIDQYR